MLAVLGSFWAPDTLAVLMMIPPEAGAVTVMVIDDAVPTARLTRVQVTTPLARLQVHPVPLALRKLTPAGRVSVTVIPVAVVGPLLVTVIE